MSKIQELKRLLESDINMLGLVDFMVNSFEHGDDEENLGFLMDEFGLSQSQAQKLVDNYIYFIKMRDTEEYENKIQELINESEQYKLVITQEYDSEYPITKTFKSKGALMYYLDSDFLKEHKEFIDDIGRENYFSAVRGLSTRNKIISNGYVFEIKGGKSESEGPGLSATGEAPTGNLKGSGNVKKKKKVR